jgi:hypothetical protein
MVLSLRKNHGCGPHCNVQYLGHARRVSSQKIGYGWTTTGALRRQDDCGIFIREGSTVAESNALRARVNTIVEKPIAWQLEDVALLKEFRFGASA